MRIAVDALGGDYAPREVVAGTISAARGLSHDELVLVGKPEAIEREVGPDPPSNVSLRSSGEAVGMDEEPSARLRANPDASVAVAARMVRDGEAEAFFSAGNTGATVAAALLRMGRLEGCRRPAIATMLPFPSPVLLLDAVATVSCRAQDLLNFAILGGVLAKRYFRLDGRPESGSSTSARSQVRATTSQRSVPSHGRVQDPLRRERGGRDISSGVADVLVTDGFTGNIVLKTAEGVAREILGMVRTAMTGDVLSKLALASFGRGCSGSGTWWTRELRWFILLGVRGSVVIGHGNSQARGVENALLGISHTGAGLTEDLQCALSAPNLRVSEGGSG